ncbi:MAG: tail fiber protein [Aliiglaciecola sp.]
MSFLNSKIEQPISRKNLARATFGAALISVFLQSSPVYANADPMLGEIQVVGFNFCPRGWAAADGQILAINQNQSLYSLLGTTYGGDGRTSFALPDLRGRIAIGYSNDIRLGSRGGAEQVSLTAGNIPRHTHTATTTSTLNASSASGRTASPDNAVLADDGRDEIYNSQAPDVTLASTAVSSTTTIGASGSQSVNNMQPSQVMTVCIALTGTFPPRN